MNHKIELVLTAHPTQALGKTKSEDEPLPLPAAAHRPSAGAI